MWKYFSGSIPFPCGNCGREFQQKISGLGTTVNFACTECRMVNQIDTAEAWETLRAIEKQLDDLGRSMRGSGKL